MEKYVFTFEKSQISLIATARCSIFEIIDDNFFYRAIILSIPRGRILGLFVEDFFFVQKLRQKFSFVDHYQLSNSRDFPILFLVVDLVDIRIEALESHRRIFEREARRYQDRLPSLQTFLIFRHYTLKLNCCHLYRLRFFDPEGAATLSERRTSFLNVPAD